MFYYFVKNICFQNKRMTFHLEEKNIESLPTEIIGEILNYCSITDIINFEQVYPQHVLNSGIYKIKLNEFEKMRYKLDSIVEDVKVEAETMREHRYQAKERLHLEM